MDRAAKRAKPAALTTAAGPSTSGVRSTTGRKTAATSQGNNIRPASTTVPSGGTNPPTDDGPQTFNTGSRPTAPDEAPPKTRAPQISCDICGKQYSTTSGLYRHKKGGCTQRTKCLYCESGFTTFNGVRQHERRAHPVEYNSQLEAKLPGSIAVILERLAEIEARSTRGAFVKEMIEATGLTKDQIRHRREKPEYSGYLERARRNLVAAERDSPVHTSSPPTPPSAPRRRALRPRTLSSRTPGSPASHPMDKRVPRVIPTRLFETDIPEDPNSERPENLHLPSTSQQSQASPEPTQNLLRQRRLSRSLPAVTCLDDFTEHLRELKEKLGTKHPTTSRLIEVALTCSDTELTPLVEQCLTELFQGHSQVERPSKANHKPAYAQKNTGRDPRAATYKKAQDLYSKSRASLAEKMLAGRPLTEEDIHPSVDSIEELYAGIYENPGPPIRETVREVKPSDRLFLPVLAEEIQQAKNNWAPSAPGPDGIKHRSVKQCDNDILSALFSVVLYKNVPIPSWAYARTTLIFKDGAREDPGNWRPITVGSMVQRLFHRVLAARLKKTVNLNVNQRGFVDGDGTLANSMILHTYITTRHRAGKSYNVISLDIRKAFDSVTHSAIRRALARHNIDAGLSAYMMQSLTGSKTIIKSGRLLTRPVNIRRGVRQGDPLSPIIFNLVLDELMDALLGDHQGGTIVEGTNCPALAFADDLVLLEDNSIKVPGMLDQVVRFMEARGMTPNPKKCVSLSTTTKEGKAVVRTAPQYRIGGQWISQANAINPFKYLGHSVGPSGIGKPNLANLTNWLNNIQRAPLKPDQKVELIRTYILPRLHYGFQTPGITARLLKDADRLIRRTVKQALHLHLHTSDAAIHAKLRDGGLGILDLRSNIPRIFLGRLVRMLERSNNDEVLSAALQHTDTTVLLTKLSDLAGDIPADQKWRHLIQTQTTTVGMELSSEDSASRSWLTVKPKGWTGRDYVRAVHLRTANLPTAAIPSRPPEERFCRGGCGCPETLNHVLQKCPVTHYERINRHNEIAKKIATHCRTKGWQVEEEPHVRHSDGQLYKPDLVVHQPGITVVADVQVSWEGNREMGEIWEEKRRVYDNAKFREAASRRWPDRDLVFTPVILGARGIWPRANQPAVDHLRMTQGLKTSCVHSSLKWGSSIHNAFMKCVWKRNNRPVVDRHAGRR